jgi:hypothetical protein
MAKRWEEAMTRIIGFILNECNFLELKVIESGTRKKKAVKKVKRVHYIY